MAARFVATSRLGNIIQMIGLSRQSGILRVVRGQGPTRELGQIRFMEGEPVSALLAHMTGQNALNVLMNWGECAYAFDEAGMDMGDDPSMYGSDYGYSPAPNGTPTSSWPSYGYGSSNGNSYSGGSTRSPLPSPPPYDPSYPYSTGQLPGSYPPYGAPQQPPMGPQTGQMGPMGQPGTDYRQAVNPAVSTTTSPSLGSGLRPEMLRAIPVRLPISEQVDQLPLDRRERMVLLLIDGQRTIADLTRLTRRNEQDLYAVLMHLHMLGLIQFR